MQLVDERTIWLDPMRERRCGVAEVRERFGVDPALVPDVLGLMGDAIDNIPGVTGIGEKTASALVRQLGPVEAIIDHLDEVERTLKKGGAAGKRLDFIAQELNREANTLAAKAASQPIAAQALELKLLVEQMREQVQNIE